MLGAACRLCTLRFLTPAQYASYLLGERFETFCLLDAACNRRYALCEASQRYSGTLLRNRWRRSGLCESRSKVSG